MGDAKTEPVIAAVAAAGSPAPSPSPSPSPTLAVTIETTAGAAAAATTTPAAAEPAALSSSGPVVVPLDALAAAYLWARLHVPVHTRPPAWYAQLARHRHTTDRGVLTQTCPASVAAADFALCADRFPRYTRGVRAGDSGGVAGVHTLRDVALLTGDDLQRMGIHPTPQPQPTAYTAAGCCATPLEGPYERIVHVLERLQPFPVMPNLPHPTPLDDSTPPCPGPMRIYRHHWAPSEYGAHTVKCDNAERGTCSLSQLSDYDVWYAHCDTCDASDLCSRCVTRACAAADKAAAAAAAADADVAAAAEADADADAGAGWSAPVQGKGKGSKARAKGKSKAKAKAPVQVTAAKAPPPIVVMAGSPAPIVMQPLPAPHPTVAAWLDAVQPRIITAVGASDDAATTAPASTAPAAAAAAAAAAGAGAAVAVKRK